MDAADHQTGGLVRFGLAAWPALRAGGELDAWIAYASGAFPTERR